LALIGELVGFFAGNAVFGGEFFRGVRHRKIAVAVG